LRVWVLMGARGSTGWFIVEDLTGNSNIFGLL
jgi:hypothetical protein